MPRHQAPCCVLVGVALCLLIHASVIDARKIFATIPYSIRGANTILGPGGKAGELRVGSQVLMHHSMLDSSGRSLGRMAGHCHVVLSQGSSHTAVCTKHLDWNDGSTMTAHGTVVIKPGSVISARLVVAGGIGRWEGAHGEDVAFRYDPAKQNGSGKIQLYCLKGVC